MAPFNLPTGDNPAPIAPPCPSWGADGALWLAHTSEIAETHAFRCAECTRIWKAGPTAGARALQLN
jgi:hypothetical protein